MPDPIVLRPFTAGPRSLFELIIQPQFGDFTDMNGVVTPSPEEGDWMIMDDVPAKRAIMELFGGQNVLKRKDATCKLIYSPVGRLGPRYIFTEALYAATEDCPDEFYQGCMEDWANEDFQTFWENVAPILETGVAADIYSNKYFGDLTRPSDITNTWSWNKFDGIFTHIAKYIASGVIPASQTFNLPVGGGANGNLTSTQAHDALQTAYDTQDLFMFNFDSNVKAFYVDQQFADAYYTWLQNAGQTTIVDLMTGRPKLFFNGIEVRVKKWGGILAALNAGVAAHVVILTIKGNFLYATDSKYGGGKFRNEAVRIWWSDDDNVWKRQVHLKAGTEIAAPQFIVIGITSIVGEITGQ